MMDLQSILKKGQDHFANGQIAEAEFFLKYVLTCQPDNCPALNGLGVIAYQRGDFKNAEKYFADALSANGDLPDTLLYLADIYIKQKRLQEAVVYLDRCVHRHPTESLYQLLVLVHEKIGNKAKADQYRAKVEQSEVRVTGSVPMVSILIPTYNRERFITECVMSAVDQCYPNYEIIVIDDGSTDNTAAVVGNIPSDKLRYIQKAHSGAPLTRNIGVQEAKGDFVLWIGSDDCLMPDTLATYRTFMAQYPDVDVFYGNLMVTDAALNDQKQIKYKEWYKRNDMMLAQLALGNCIPDGGSLIKKSCYDRAGNYDEEFTRAHDYEWWTRLVGFATFKHVGAFVYKWRWHNSNMSTGSVKIDTSFEARILHKLLERHSLRELYPQIAWDSTEPELAEALVNYQLYIPS